MAPAAFQDPVKNHAFPCPYTRSFTFRGRKRARKSQPSQGIIIKKSPPGIIIDGFQILNMIGCGSYGTVYRAMDKKTGEIVAMKKEITGLSETTLREIDILESLRGHPSVVEFKRVVKDVRKGKVYVVMEYLENDLDRYMESSMKGALDIRQVKGIMKQLLEGVKFLHDNGVMHRDLKPSNILMSQHGSLKICDFGLSRRFGIGVGSDEKESYSPKVASLCYRAPELLFGTEEYSCAIDMWSVGCIMGELLMKKVLFDGDSELGQLRLIFETLGTPENVSIYIPGFDLAKFVGQRHNLLKDKINGEGATMLCDRGFDLLNGFLAYEPAMRLTAAEALKHSWFREDS